MNVFVKECLESDLVLISLKVESFPLGIQAAFSKLQSSISECNNRTFYGKSIGDGFGKIVYWAAVNYNPETDILNNGFELTTIRKGNYYTYELQDFEKNKVLVKDIFEQMLKLPEVDLITGYCLEEYTKNGNVKCMIKLK